MKCYGLADGQRPWPPKGLFGGGQGSPPELITEAKPLILGTFHSSAKLLSQKAYKSSQHWQIIEFEFSALFNYYARTRTHHITFALYFYNKSSGRALPDFARSGSLDSDSFNIAGPDPYMRQRKYARQLFLAVTDHACTWPCTVDLYIAAYVVRTYLSAMYVYTGTRIPLALFFGTKSATVKTVVTVAVPTALT